MKLRYIMLIIMLPMLALVGYFCVVEYRLLSAAKVRAEHTALATQETTRLYVVIDEIQSERGYTAGVISSRGANFRAELAKQRAAVDEAFAALPTEFTGLSASAQITSFVENMGQIGSWRARVDSGDVAASEVFEFYTAIINVGLEATSAISDRDEVETLATLTQARAILAQAKEYAGQERGAVLGGIISGAISKGLAERIIYLRALQEFAIRRAATALGDEMMAERLLADPAATSLKRSREIMVNAAFGEPLGGLTAAEWFAGSTAWLDAIGAMEDSIGKRLSVLSLEVADQAKSRLVGELTVFLSAIAAVFLFSLIVFERMIRRFRSLTLVMAQFIEGNFKAHVPFTESNSEMNVMARSIYRFKQETLARMRDAESRKQTDEAVLNAKHQRVVDLVTEGLAALAHADLTRHFDTPLDGEYDAIRTDFNTASGRLRDVMVTLAATISDLDERSSEMLDSSNDLAQRTVEQDQTLRTTTSQVMHLSAAVDAYGAEIISASEMAGFAKKSTGQSSETMRKAIESMARIEDSSKKISQIISLIEDISFQTNLLALNAGVEAARAGDSGRGFAVVASEVRDLARRSSQAATEIKGLIDNASREVAAGVNLVDQAGGSLGLIFEKIDKMDEVLESISRTAGDQTKGLKEFSAAMVRLAELTQENTAMVEQTRSASSEMAQSSRHLAELIRDFDLGTDDRAPNFSTRRAA